MITSLYFALIALAYATLSVGTAHKGVDDAEHPFELLRSIFLQCNISLRLKKWVVQQAEPLRSQATARQQGVFLADSRHLLLSSKVCIFGCRRDPRWCLETLCTSGLREQMIASLLAP